MLMIRRWVVLKRTAVSFGQLCRNTSNSKILPIFQKYLVGTMSLCDQGLALHPEDFAKQCVELYEQLSGKKVKHFRIPHCDGGTLVDTNDQCVGQLSASSAKLVMKLMWLGRISRPDIMVAINTLARNITRWSTNYDKRAARLVGCIAATVDYAHVMRIKDLPAKLWLSLFVDSDFGSSPDMKPTSGFIIALEGPDSFAIILCGSKNPEGCLKINDRSRVCCLEHRIVWRGHLTFGSLSACDRPWLHS